MTVQWVLVASFLYFELGLTILLVLPFISPKIWKSILHLQLWKVIERKAKIYFGVFIMVLILLLLDSIREMIKYSEIHPHDNAGDIQLHMKLFRSQRNYYIVGFSIFLCLVIRRLIMLIVAEADLMTKSEEAEKRAQEAGETAQKLTIEDTTVDKSHMKVDPKESFLKEIETLEKELENKNNEFNSVKQSRESLLERHKELLKEYENLQEKIDGLKRSLSTATDDEVD